MSFPYKLIVLSYKSWTRLFATPWTVAYQASPSMGFSRQEYWSELPFLSPADLPDPGIKPRSPALQADALPSEPRGKPLNTYNGIKLFHKSKIEFLLYISLYHHLQI